MYQNSANIKNQKINLSGNSIKFNNKLIDLQNKREQDYFNELVTFLVQETGLSYCFIGKYFPKSNSVKTIAFSSHGLLSSNFSYELADTPCSTIIEKNTCCFPQNVQQLFPKDKDLLDLNVESYIGFPFFTPSEMPLGILVLMGENKIGNPQKLEEFINIFFRRAELELSVFTNKIDEDTFMNSFYFNINEVTYSMKSDDNQPMVNYISSQVLNVFGVEKTSFIKNPSQFIALYHPDDLLILREEIEEGKREKAASITMTYRFYHQIKKGYVWIEDSMTFRYNSDGDYIGYNGIAKEVTINKKENLRKEIAFIVAEKSQRRLINIYSLSDYINEILQKLINVSNFYVAVEEDDKLNFLYFKDEIDSPKGKSFIRPFLNNGLTEYIIKSKHVINEIGKDLTKIIKKKKLNAKGKMPETFIGIPLKSDGLSVGAMVVQSYDKKIVFEKEDVELLTFIASQVAVIIDRKLFQDKLIYKEEYFRSLVENSTEIIGIIDENGTIEYTSESIFRILGYQPFELIGNNITDFVHTDGLLQKIRERNTSINTGDIEVLKVIDKKGQKKYLEISINKHQSKDVSEKLIFNAKDVTGKVIADKKREFSQRRLNTLHQVEKTLISDKTLEEKLNNALKVINKNILEIDRASIWLIDHKEKTSKNIALFSKNTNTLIGIGDKIPFKDLTSIKTVLKKKHFYVSDLNKLKSHKKSYLKIKKEGIQSYYIKPIIINDEVIGTFNFGSNTKKYFDNIDKELLEEITLLVAVVVNDGILKKELAERQDDLTTIFNLTNEGILKTNNEGEFLAANRQICEMFGYTEKEMLTKTYRDITYKDDLKISDQAFNDFKKNGGILQIDKRYITKSGDILYCHVTAKPVYDAEGKFEYTATFLNNLTKEKEAQRRVEDFKDALNYSAAVFYSNINGCITDVNNRVQILSGYTEKELINSSVNIFNSRDHAEEEWNLMWKTIKLGKTWQGEIKNKHKNGYYYWVFQTITPIFTSSGEIEQFISIQFDITDEKLAKTDLIKEVIEAQEHEREKFATEIHDGLGQVLLASKMNLQAISDTVNNSDKRTAAIFNKTIGLLADAVYEARSISHGLMSRVLNRFGIAHAVSDIINNINTTQNIKFDFEHNIYQKRFKEDVEMGIYRTLQELINNIIRHAEATEACLKIMKKNEKLEIEIQDNGIGIKTGIVNNKENTGIGLKNMKSRIQYLGGTFKINEKINTGTKINITLTI